MRILLRIIVFSITVLIIYSFGIFERTHLDEHSIPFNIQIVQPDHITCGPVTAQMLIHYYGNTKVTLDEIKSLTKTVWFSYEGQDFGMTSPNYISVALNRFGIDNRIRRGNLDVIKHYLCKNKPCIVLVRSGEFTWHYLVIIGFDKDFVYICDTNGTSYSQSNKIFIKSWNWETDTQGTAYKYNQYCLLLHMIEVYSNTFIVPN